MSVFPLKDLLEYEIISPKQYETILNMYAGNKFHVPKKEFDLNNIKECYEQQKAMNVENKIIFQRVSQMTGKSERTIRRYRQKGLINED